MNYLVVLAEYFLRRIPSISGVLFTEFQSLILIKRGTKIPLSVAVVNQISICQLVTKRKELTGMDLPGLSLHLCDQGNCRCDPSVRGSFRLKCR